jgi:hypothetical protein
MKNFEKKYAEIAQQSTLVNVIKSDGKPIGELREIGDNKMVVIDLEKQNIVELGLTRTNDEHLYDKLLNHWKSYANKDVVSFVVYPERNTFAIWT